MPPKQKNEIDIDKNISKRFLLCYNINCTKDDGLPALATKLCPYCYKVGYCCKICFNKDISKHLEKDCQKNFQTEIPIKSTDKSIDKKNSTKNINDYISQSEESSDESVDSIPLRKSKSINSTVVPSNKLKNGRKKAT